MQRIVPVDGFKATAFKLHCEGARSFWLTVIGKGGAMRGIIILVAGMAVLSVSSPAVRGQSPVVPSNQSSEAATTECDTYAADPFDPKRRADGVPFERINPVLAIRACENAVRQYPISARLAFQLARAFDKNTDYNSALVHTENLPSKDMHRHRMP